MILGPIDRAFILRFYWKDLAEIIEKSGYEWKHFAKPKILMCQSLNALRNRCLIQVEKNKILITDKGITAIQKINRREFGLNPELSFSNSEPKEEEPQKEEKDEKGSLDSDETFDQEEAEKEVVPDMPVKPFEVPDHIRLKLVEIKRGRK